MVTPTEGLEIIDSMGSSYGKLKKYCIRVMQHRKLGEVFLIMLTKKRYFSIVRKEKNYEMKHRTSMDL